MIIFETNYTCLAVSKCYPLFDIGKQKDKRNYNTVYYLHLFGFCFSFEIVHYRPE